MRVAWKLGIIMEKQKWWVEEEDDLLVVVIGRYENLGGGGEIRGGGGWRPVARGFSAQGIGRDPKALMVDFAGCKFVCSTSAGGISGKE